MTAHLPLDGPRARAALDLLRAYPHGNVDEESFSTLAAGGRLEEVVALLELHGILPVCLASLSGSPTPGGEGSRDLVSAMQRREQPLRSHAARTTLTTERILRACAERGLTPVLLKGASLFVDVYPEPWLRPTGDVDLLMSEEDLPLAIEAAYEAGLAVAPERLPLFYYRLVHFHLKLHPAANLLCEVELHWALQSPALLLTVKTDDVLARTRRFTWHDMPVRTLDPLDRYLHLATHLLSHWGETAPLDDEGLVLSLLTSAAPPARLKWILDLRLALERMARDGVDAPALIDRAEEWSALPALCRAIGLARVVGLADGARPLADDVLRRSGQDPVGFPWRDSPDRARRSFDAVPRPARGLDFRLSALGGIFRWAFPPREYFERRPPPRGFLRRMGHALRVLARVKLAALLLPVALLGRRLQARGRRRRMEELLSHERVFELVRASRARSRGGR